MVLSELSKHRLSVLRDFLRDKVPDERFDLSTWAGSTDHLWGGEADLSCGTVACAAGFAATIPALRELGFHLRQDVGGFSHNGYPVFEGKTRMYAVAKLLDITQKQAAYLFDPHAYTKGDMTSRKEALFRIDCFLEMELSDEEIVSEFPELANY